MLPACHRPGVFRLKHTDSPEAFLNQLRDPKKDWHVTRHMLFVARTVSQALTGAPDWKLVALFREVSRGLNVAMALRSIFLCSRAPSFSKEGE